MPKRSSHVAKTGRQKEYYVKQLGTLGYEPTVEEEPVFPDSDELEKDYSVPTNLPRRPTTFSDSAQTFIKKNWTGLVISLIAGLIILFCYNFSKDIGMLQGSLNEIRNSFDSLQKRFDKVDDKVQEQENKIREQGVQIYYLERNSK